MRSRKKLLRYLVVFAFQLFLSGKAFAAVPVESSHYNTNTYANLNTITSTGTITFTAAYDVSGDIKWYKDNVLVQTNTSTATASLSTAWTASDYGMVKQMRVNSTNVDGTSIDTVWNVEVQQTGTATISKNSGSGPRIEGMSSSIYIANGWTNMPSLYLAAKQSDNAWIEYLKEKTYIVKKGILVSGATLNLTCDTVMDIKLQGIPKLTFWQAATMIRAENNATLTINGVKFYGWNSTSGSEMTLDNESPIVASFGNNRMDVKNSNFRHVLLCYNGDKSVGDIVDNNTFYEGSPFDLGTSYYGTTASNLSGGQTFSNNVLTGAGSFLFLGQNDISAGGTVIKNNKCLCFPGKAAQNMRAGSRAKCIGNELETSSWNIIEAGDSLSLIRDNNVHGTCHNAINEPKDNTYLSNNYGHHVDGLASLYIQLESSSQTSSEDAVYHDNIYIANHYAKDSAEGIQFHGVKKCYIYNFTAENIYENAVIMGADKVIYRKSSFHAREDAYAALTLTDYLPETWGYVKDVYVIDTKFSYLNIADYSIISTADHNGNPILYSVNSYRKNLNGSITIPVFKCYYGTLAHGEVREYAYLDVLVQDSSGNPVPGAVVTAASLTDTSYPPVKVVLPPPLPARPDERPVDNPPMPDIQTLDAGGILTGTDGHTPLPNYGWSEDPEATPGLMFYRQRPSGNTDNYQYRITAAYNGQISSVTVTPDASWLREDPLISAKTIVLTLNKPAGKYALNVNGGTGSGLYDHNQSVSISAPNIAGKVFKRWIGDTAGIADAGLQSTSITVQAKDASLSAYYEDVTYHLTVAGGTGSGDYPAGRMIAVDADKKNGSLDFYKWTGSGASSLVTPACFSSILYMPAQDVTVTANYRNPVSSYTCHLTVVDGEGTDFYAPGDNVAISAPVSPFSDMLFDHWEGDTANLADTGSCTTTLTAIPDEYQIVYPVYRASGLASNDANLSNLAISPGDLSPWFSRETTGYTGVVGTDVNSVTVTPTASRGANAVITVNGTVVNSGSASGAISLNLNGSTTTITIIVTAPDTTTTKTYTIAVKRVALATAYTITAPEPASGPVKIASGNFTVTPNGAYTGTVTLKPSGGGLTDWIRLGFTGSNTPRTFTIKPKSAGTITLTPSNSGGLTDPSSVTYTATACAPGAGRNTCWSYPNPADFSKVNKMTIVYTVARESAVTIRLYTAAGDLVKTLVNNETTAAGEHQVDWQGDTDSGRKAASGVYFCVAKMGKDVVISKAAIIR